MLLPLLSATSSWISLSFASTSGAGTRFVFFGGEVGDCEREDAENSVTVALSSDSWRVWQMVCEPAVEGRVVAGRGSHL